MDKNQSKYMNLITSVDVMNTLNGGRTEPVVKLHQHTNSREVRVKIPGISPEKIEVEVNENRVVIFYMMTVATAGKEVGIPYSVYDRQQPYFIDVSKIVAQVEEAELVVTLPFNQLANGYHKRVKKRED
ncbi:MAG TPA: Hsp20/alpha crystallin family protein [Chryseolinea sp.]|nr:Hsp20/alpha crystallin family protein [Chryseolinea sp.]